MTIIQKIFKDHFQTVVSSGITIRDTVFENVQKMINCGNPQFGYALYGCDGCGKFRIVPFRCKSRFCTTCGNLYSLNRAEAISIKLYHTSHRHCVFTMPEQLRPFSCKTVNC